MIVDVEKTHKSDRFWRTEKYCAQIPVWNIKQLWHNKEDDVYCFELMGEEDFVYIISKEDFLKISVAISKMEGVK